ncbi:tRNA(Ile)-lysidine synthetase [Campylobacter pinnipediorum subsp. pinnipediorum]|uniref:tRNA lysidine(34) synthetase TilS n=1 Tax=Campylobacter pinnipediorum TaxID=1965231 RepID=UPI00084D84A7|nr:tRNA lysidine(34) synthetase TilS [Campylobacter pinnipediorum]AQW81487.1 tRNA(Ile)-lysidine synthetase [Campylobacter pinnipediorum subsp. pinnipediorum]
MISKNCITHLKNGKNLLAFSHGVDSTALFYLLDELGVDFDIAIINYNTRKNSTLEATSAKNLAYKFNKKCFLKSVKLQNKNFESEARKIRYNFFKEICINEKYTNLILAHQLNDMFEWFLMQFSKGAGLNELIGMQEIEKKEHYTLIRPILNIQKDELNEYLDKNNYKYFVDESNFSNKYTRNHFRLEFSNQFIKQYSKGVKKSFEFLNLDYNQLKPKYKKIKDDFYLVYNDKNAIRGIDKVCKKLGVLMSQSQRLTALKDGVISGKIAIGIKDDIVFISPFVKEVMDKKFKEKCRKAFIPKLIRPYLFQINFEIEKLDYNKIFETTEVIAV